MKIVIVGLGRMGLTLAQHLDEEGHQLIAVDTDPAVIARVQSRLDVMALEGSGFHLGSIDATDVKDADLLVAVTGMDEVNLITCLLARKFGISRHIARIENPKLIRELGELERIAFINPQQVTVDRLATTITSVGTTESTEFVDGAILLRALLAEADSPIIGRPLAKIRDEFSHPFIVTMVKREMTLFMARGDTVIEPGDTIYVVLERQSLDAFVEHFGFRPRANRVIVFGASPIGCGLCEALEGKVPDVILLEPSADLVDAAAPRLSSTSLIHGSPFEQDLLHELKIGTADYFVSLSTNDEGNLAAAMMAKRLGTRTTVTLTSQPEFVDIFAPLPHLDAVVSPIFLSVGEILKRVRSGRVHSLTMVAGRRGEALELEVLPGAPVDGRAVKDIAFPPGMVLAAVRSGTAVSVPIGSTVLAAGQHVVAVALRDAVKATTDLFGVG